jgi:beta-aspartyl-peptidase (threonine type)
LVLISNPYLSNCQIDIMRCLLLLQLGFLLASCSNERRSNVRQISPPGPITLVIHGGAGTILRSEMSAEQEKEFTDKLLASLDSGFAILEGGGKSLDAVIAAIKVMEDSPLFNAGKGAVFTHDGRNEMDASIMDGSDLMAGAVAGVTTIKNPILAAHAVMTKSKHVLMVGKGAEQFAEEEGLEIVSPSYFFDSARYQQLLRSKNPGKETGTLSRDRKFGTVGCVALDQHGNLAAGTSTGGMTNKKFGRVGDSPIIGAGTYANNVTCAVSGTGWGEYFIRLNVAHDVSALMEYGGLSLDQAADSVIMKKLPGMGGEGGLIALDRQGHVAMTFCTEGMYRGYITKKGQGKTFIYSD